MPVYLTTEDVIVRNIYPASYLHFTPGPTDKISVYNAPIPVVNRRTGNVLIIGRGTFAERAKTEPRIRCYVINVSEESEEYLEDIFGSGTGWKKERLIEALSEIETGASYEPMGFDPELLDDAFEDDASQIKGMFDKKHMLDELFKGFR